MLTGRSDEIHRDARARLPGALAGSLPRHKAPRLAAVLLQQFHVIDGHAAVHGLTHVVNGQQGDRNLLIYKEFEKAKSQ